MHFPANRFKAGMRRRGGIPYRRPPAREEKGQFKEFEAAELYCPKCKASVHVRKRLLLVLPDGEKFDYICTRCGNPIGGKIESHQSPQILLR